MPHFLEYIKAWVQYNAALWKELNTTSVLTPRMLFSNLALLYFCRLFRYVDITEALTISPITWLSLRSVRLTPRMPNTTKTIAPVSTRGRTAGWPHAPPLHGLKPSVLDGLVLAADEGSVKIGSKENLLTAFIYTVKFP